MIIGFIAIYIPGYTLAMGYFDPEKFKKHAIVDAFLLYFA